MQTTFPIRRRQSLGFLVSLCAFGALANCAKADIVAAQELTNGRVLVNNPEAYIGDEQNHVDTPWMIVSPDAKSGFANDFTINAISVVSEDGTNFYAHIESERLVNGRPEIDRTKVIHFTVDQNGIPSKTGEVIDTMDSEVHGSFSQMARRKLIGIKDGRLLFGPTDPSGTFFSYRPNEASISEGNGRTHVAICQNNSITYTLQHDYATQQYILQRRGKELTPKEYTLNLPKSEKPSNILLTTLNDDFYFLVSENNNFQMGRLRNTQNTTLEPDESGTLPLPGPISGLSNNGEEVFATTTATNAFYNVALEQYNVVADENGNPTPMVPPTQEGLVRVIDNRKKGGKFLYVTATGIYSVD